VVSLNLAGVLMLNTAHTIDNAMSSFLIAIASMLDKGRRVSVSRLRRPTCQIAARQPSGILRCAAAQANGLHRHYGQGLDAAEAVDYRRVTVGTNQRVPIESSMTSLVWSSFFSLRTVRIVLTV
jgi:hypothetical protein